MGETFRQLLLRYLEPRQLTSARKLSVAVGAFYRALGEPQLATLSPQTIQHWIRPGDAGLPHNQLDVLRVAATLGLNKVRTTQLLLAAGKPSVDALLESVVLLPAPASQAPGQPLPEQELLRRVLQPWLRVAPNNLPAIRSSFIGREAETMGLAELLTESGVRLVTLTGPGGSGKTRLALQTARLLLDTFADGVYFVPLELIDDPQQITAAILRALRLQVGDYPSRQRRLIGHLEGRRVLLVLDNFEHLPAAVPHLTELLDHLAGLQLLVTSRVPLRAYGEHEWPVAPLPLPGRASAPQVLQQNPAAALFAARARAAAPGFAIDRANSAAVSQICTLLAGLPLALELAAARVREYPPQELLHRYTQALDLAADGPIDRPLRQQSLRRAIAWSDRLLTADQRCLFHRLAVFRGGLPPEAVELVCAECDPADGAIGATLDHLVAHALVVAEPGDGAARYRLLEPIREFAWEELSADEALSTSRRHAEWCTALAERMAYPLEGGQEGDRWLATIDRELANMYAALAWSAEHDPEAGLRLAAAIWPYWFIRQELREGWRWLGDLLDRATSSNPWRAKALCGLGMLHFWDDLAASYEHLSGALALAEAQRDRQLIAATCWPLSFVAFVTGRIAQARLHLEAGAPLANLPDRPGLRGVYRMMQGYLAEQAGRRLEAVEYLRSALADMADADQPLFMCQALFRLNSLTLGAGDYAQAREQLGTLRQLAERIGSPVYRMLVWYRQGMLGEATNDLDAAEEAFATCLRLSEEFEGSRFERATSLVGMGRIALLRGKAREALSQLEEAADLATQFKNQRTQREVSLPLVLARWENGRRGEALRSLAEVLATWEKASEPSWRTLWTEVAATLAIKGGDLAPAVTWLAAVDRARREGLPSRTPLVQQRARAALSLARAGLGAAAYQKHWAAGEAWTPEQALAAARAWLDRALERPTRARDDTTRPAPASVPQPPPGPQSGAQS